MNPNRVSAENERRKYSLYKELEKKFQAIQLFFVWCFEQ